MHAALLSLFLAASPTPPATAVLSGDQGAICPGGKFLLTSDGELALCMPAKLVDAMVQASKPPPAPAPKAAPLAPKTPAKGPAKK
ncbi:MAG TPA: hypothetical protein VMB50_20865 [Myxococcales bacterium]|nr:hypothetical protein [Myxococcales bacterium]